MRIFCILFFFLYLPIQASYTQEQDTALVGFDSGLYSFESSSFVIPLWQEAGIKKIVKTGEGWIFLSSRGIVFSNDLLTFEYRNNGLPEKILKYYLEGTKTYSSEIQELKDLEKDPYDPNVLATCTKDAVFVSRDSGRTWISYPNPNATSGIKCVAVFSMPAPVVMVSHPIKGLLWRKIDDTSSLWTPANLGLITAPRSTMIEEISDLHITKGEKGPIVFAANSFQKNIYRMDWGSKGFDTIYSDKKDFGAAESLIMLERGLAFVTENTIQVLENRSKSILIEEYSLALAKKCQETIDSQLECLWYLDKTGRELSFSELWLVERFIDKPYLASAKDKYGLYLSPSLASQDISLAKYIDFLDNRNLNMIVVDMKDDFGNLRFTPKSELLKKIGKTRGAIDIEGFVQRMKQKNTWLVARIVVFKDEVLYKYQNSQYAVWDSSAKSPWRGYYRVKREVSPRDTQPQSAEMQFERQYNNEYWVDPYCENVWEYNIEIAKEMVDRGFDEIQFDYIRFPTDGDNLSTASYRFWDKGMDKESALMSFFIYARANIKAAISIDIYGANGWYRSGARTGQDVELLQKYVDIICPMFYPSHFEQSFYGYEPAAERPYRIYFFGTNRCWYIAKKNVVVRPYVQAFYLNVSYDKKYYDTEYVRREVNGVRDSINLGLTFWNNSGRYDDIPVINPDFVKDNSMGEKQLP